MKIAGIVFITAISTVAPAQSGDASKASDSHATILDCVSRMDVSTTWDQCRRMMFLPCENDAVGSEPHITCLKEEKSSWSSKREHLFDEVNAKLTLEGSASLVDLIGQWIGYVGQKCGDVAKAKADISSEAAQLGCEISENVGLSAELKACLDDRSTAPYCVFKE